AASGPRKPSTGPVNVGDLQEAGAPPLAMASIVDPVPMAPLFADGAGGRRSLRATQESCTAPAGGRGGPARPESMHRSVTAAAGFRPRFGRRWFSFHRSSAGPPPSNPLWALTWTSYSNNPRRNRRSVPGSPRSNANGSFVLLN